jgi:hypothetical protein
MTFTDTNVEEITNEENYKKNLGKFNFELKTVEDNFRRKFLERNPKEYSSSLGNELLINVFAERHSFKSEAMETYEGWCGDLLMDTQRNKEFDPDSIVDRVTFLSRWNSFTHNAFTGVNWDNIFVAGGAVLGALIHSPVEHSFHNSDIDIFVHSLNAEEATKKIFEVCNVINKNVGGEGHVLVSQHSVTLLGIYPFRHVQFILRLYRWKNYRGVANL